MPSATQQANTIHEGVGMIPWHPRNAQEEDEAEGEPGSKPGSSTTAHEHPPVESSSRKSARPGSGRELSAQPIKTMRLLSDADMPFMQRMLQAAAYWQTDDDRPNESIPEEALRYITDWGRPGDLGVIAIDELDSPVGAASYRLFPEDEPGYGFIDCSIPELTIAVRANGREQGIGTKLLQALVERAVLSGHRGLSLSVSSDNPAVRLYQRLGFRKVGEAEGSWTMLLSLVR